MSIRHAAVGLGLLFILACSGDGLTQLDDSTLQVQAPLLSQGASGAMTGTDFDLASYDDNEDGAVCIKTVPGGNGKAAPRTIIRDNDANGECPGGFEEVAASLEPCDFSKGIPATNCDCGAVGGVEFGGACYPGG